MKILKYLAIFFGISIVLLMSTCAIMSKTLPEGESGAKAEALADKMLNSINKQAWDTTRYAQWTFRGKNHYLWDRKDNLAQVSWNNYRVLLDPDQVTGLVYDGNVQLDGAKKDKVFKKAWSNWCNDMFWFCAPYKIKDPGTRLSIVNHEEGDRLKVSYDSGGVTPGDSYIWILDENGTPMAYEMYVKIIPLKGIKVNWGGWKKLPTGAMISTEHKSGSIGMELKNVAGGNLLSDVGLTDDIWSEIR